MGQGGAVALPLAVAAAALLLLVVMPLVVVAVAPLVEAVIPVAAAALLVAAAFSLVERVAQRARPRADLAAVLVKQRADVESYGPALLMEQCQDNGGKRGAFLLYLDTTGDPDLPSLKTKDLNISSFEGLIA